MGIFAEFTDEDGRECVIYRPGTLREAELNYAPCGAESPDDEEEPMDPITIARADVLRFQYGEATGGGLSRKAAADTLDRLTRQEMARHAGMTYAEAFARVRKVNGELVRAYAGQAMSIEDHLKRAGQGDVLLQDEGGTRYHVHRPLPSSPTLDRLRELQELKARISDEIRELAKLAEITLHEAAERVLDDPRYKDVPAEIVDSVRDFYTPPTLR